MPNPSSSIRKHVLAVRRSLSSLDRSLARLTAALNGFGSRSASATAPESRRPPKRKLSSRARAALKLQGRYMGYMRQLRPKQKALVRAVLVKSGKKAAIRKAQMLVGKGKAA